MIFASVSDLAFVGWRIPVADRGVGGSVGAGSTGRVCWDGRVGTVGVLGVDEGEGGREAGFQLASSVGQICGDRDSPCALGGHEAGGGAGCVSATSWARASASGCVQAPQPQPSTAGHPRSW